MLERLYEDVADIRRAIQDARRNARNRAFTSEAACDAALERLHELERRFPDLQKMLQRRENARKQQTTNDRIAALEARVKALEEGRIVSINSINRERKAE
jgi:predicted nuclease with TOPRIM domain